MKRPKLEDGKTTPWWILLYEYEKYVKYLEKHLRNYEEIADLFPKEKLLVR